MTPAEPGKRAIPLEKIDPVRRLAKTDPSGEPAGAGIFKRPEWWETVRLFRDGSVSPGSSEGADMTSGRGATPRRASRGNPSCSPNSSPWSEVSTMIVSSYIPRRLSSSTSREISRSVKPISWSYRSMSGREVFPVGVFEVREMGSK